jgi:hypothetical protein
LKTDLKAALTIVGDAAAPAAADDIAVISLTSASPGRGQRVRSVRFAASCAWSSPPQQ